MGTFFHWVEKAAVHTHLIQQIIFGKGQEIVLDLFQIPFTVQKIDRGKKLGNVAVVFMKTVMVPDTAILIGNIGKGQHILLDRGKFLTEIPIPGVPPFIGADFFA